MFDEIDTKKASTVFSASNIDENNDGAVTQNK
jgi:hypothetical protein